MFPYSGQAMSLNGRAKSSRETTVSLLRTHAEGSALRTRATGAT